MTLDKKPSFALFSKYAWGGSRDIAPASGKNTISIQYYHPARMSLAGFFVPTNRGVKSWNPPLTSSRIFAGYMPYQEHPFIARLTQSACAYSNVASAALSNASRPSAGSPALRGNHRAAAQINTAFTKHRSCAQLLALPQTFGRKIFL